MRPSTPTAGGPRPGWRALAVLASLLVSACATYDERLADTHTVFYDGRLELAVRQLEVALEESLAEGGTDAGVLRLELAMACQAAGRYAEAVEHLKLADAQLEVLDYTDDPLDTIAEFVFAPEAREYHASPPERVMVNTQNMLNQMLAGDLQGAEVEARRLINLLVRTDLDPDALYANRFAWGLAGLVLLAAGDPAPANDALARAEGTGLEVPNRVPPDLEGPTGTLLVVAQTGRVPVRREAIYVFPVGGRTVRVNLPSLVRRPPAYHTVTLSVDGERVGQLPVVYDLGDHARKRYDDEMPRLLAAAISQALPRAVASEAIGAAAELAAKGAAVAAEAKAEDEGASDLAVELAGALASITIELVGALVASIADWLFAEAQRSDTRCWSLLPEHLCAMRLDLPPGPHRVRLWLSGRAPSRELVYEVDVPERGLAVINAITSTEGGDLDDVAPPVRSLASHKVEEALRLIEASAALRAVLVD